MRVNTRERQPTNSQGQNRWQILELRQDVASPGFCLIIRKFGDNVFMLSLWCYKAKTSQYLSILNLVASAQ